MSTNPALVLVYVLLVFFICVEARLFYLAHLERARRRDAGATICPTCGHRSSPHTNPTTGRT